MNRLFASFFLVALSSAALFAQTEYPPETKAIPIPKIEDLPLTDGPFKGTIDSLKQFKCPDWFRDGKFGIWAHWGPQAVPGDGDWYARKMYDPTDGDYNDHVKVYGHPSKEGSGYKDIIPLWHAEKWDPDRLMALYKAAGAHYFVAQAVHHDNFDNWNSKYHKWNSVQMGPKQDVVGRWQKAAKEQGLRFGVSEHLGASFTWFQSSHQSDITGPLAGVPYDGANPAFWDLYHMPAKPGDDAWYSNDPVWIQEWYARIYDLVDQYKPDLLYSDGGYPFKEVGLRMVAELYNVSIKNNGGNLEAIYNCKANGNGGFNPAMGVEDVERGGMSEIQPYPWQTDTSTGDWFYRKGDHYKTTGEIVHTLMDIVSKNGNLLMNVVQYPDGSLPPEMETFLVEMADWMKVNGDAVFSTRPWTIYGEGPSLAIKQGAFNDNVPFLPNDLRFTRKGNDLYVTTLGIPTDSILVRALATDSPLVKGEVGKVTLLGYDGEIQTTRSAEGLTLQIPPNLSLKQALCFKISGFTTVDLTPEAVKTYRADAALAISTPLDSEHPIQLLASQAEPFGTAIRIQGEPDGASLAYWGNAGDGATWKMKVGQPGKYQVSIDQSSLHDGAEYSIAVGAAQINGKSVNTGGYEKYKNVDVGTVSIETAGVVTVKIMPVSAATWAAMNLRSIRLTAKP